MAEHKTVGLTYANYNYAFVSFYSRYKSVCVQIAENTKLKNLKDIRKIITTFIYENEYTIADESKRAVYRKKLFALKIKSDGDIELRASLTKDLEYTVNKIQYKRKYYEYFLDYLLIMGTFVSELTSTYMPNTNLQRKLLRFTNNQMFFEKFTEHKENVIEALAAFDIRNFTEGYNKLITFYYAYSLFINDKDKETLVNMFSYALTYYLSKDTLLMLEKQEITSDQALRISKKEALLHRILLYSISLMNQSFSNYDVLPKLQNKVYIDKTLI